MSPEMIIGLVAIVMLALVSIAITVQGLEKQRKERLRLATALNKRARSFEQMLSGFPEGLLGNDLKLLVCHCLMEVYNRLHQLEPKHNPQTAAQKRTQASIDTLKAAGKSATHVPDLHNPEQIKEIQQDLTSLFNFIAKLRVSNRITEEESQRYAIQLRRLMIKTNLDLLNIHARQAIKSGNLKLALHHYQAAIDKIKKEDEADYFSNHLQGYSERIEQLKQQMAEREMQRQASMEKKQHNPEAQQADWQKKQDYD